MTDLKTFLFSIVVAGALASPAFANGGPDFCNPEADLFCDPDPGDCEIDPFLPWCEPEPDECEFNPGLPWCEPDLLCEDDPELPWCEIDPVEETEPEDTTPIYANVSVKIEGAGDFSLSSWQRRELSQMKPAEQTRFLARVVASRLAKGMGTAEQDRIYRAFLADAGDSWCGPCRMLEGQMSLGGGITAFISADF